MSVPNSGRSRFDVEAQSVLRSNLVSGKRETTRFPLEPGKSWQYEYELKLSQYPTNIYVDLKAVVGDWEEVTVPAGTFRALKIEHRGRWRRDLDFGRDGRTGQIQGRIQATYWYAPAAKAVVKMKYTDYRTDGGVDDDFEEELVELSLAEK